MAIFDDIPEGAGLILSILFACLFIFAIGGAIILVIPSPVTVVIFPNITTTVISSSTSTIPATIPTTTLIPAPPSISNMGSMEIDKSCNATTCVVTAVLSGYDPQIPFGNLFAASLGFPTHGQYNVNFWPNIANSSAVFTVAYSMNATTGLAYSHTLSCSNLDPLVCWYPQFELSGSQTTPWCLYYDNPNHRPAIYCSDSVLSVP